MLVFEKDFTQQEPIPEEAIEKAVEVLRSGRLHRYNLLPGEKGLVCELEEKFAAYIGSKQSAELQREIRRQEKELAAMRKRKTEVDTIFKKLYEDSVLGCISTEQFQMLSGSYTEEQNQIAAGIPQKEMDIQRLRETVNGTDGFIDKAKRYTDITKLTPELLRLFIEKIVVHEKEVKWSKHAPQTVEIYYNGIGYVGSGQQDVEETMEAPEPLQTQETEEPRQAS